MQRSTGLVEVAARELRAPPVFELGDGLSGSVEHFAALGGREDEFGSAVGGVRAPFEVAELLQFVDEFRAGRETELCPRGEVGEPDAVDADVAPHVQVREANVEELAVCLRVGEQLLAELVKQPAEDLTDGEAVRREFS